MKVNVFKEGMTKEPQSTLCKHMELSRTKRTGGATLLENV